jgi:hypothetical protein
MKPEIHLSPRWYSASIRVMQLASRMVIVGLAAGIQSPAAAQAPIAPSPAAASFANPAVSKTRKLTPTDFSKIRGANYRSANAGDTTDYWRHYDPKETERDLGYADRLQLNQIRVFVNHAGWSDDQAKFRKNLVDLAQACERHKIGLMVVVGNTETMTADDPARAIDFDAARDLVTDLVKTIRNEPALAFWDASNEPDYNAAPAPPDRERKRLELARFIATTFHKLDQNTPVTIGVAFERNMETLADAVDVLSFHDYLQTRAAISRDIARAKAFAAGAGKPVINTEIGCVARANPYDVTLEEHMNGGVGWYIWELMITRRWGNVHGVFYPDGTVRDPSIPAAMLGMFRNRSSKIVPENPDRENWVSKGITGAKRWLDTPEGSWEEGLNAAETLANLLEGGQLIAMREPPTRTIDLMRQGKPDIAALRELVQKYIFLLEPYQK